MDIIGYFLGFPIVSELPDASENPGLIVLYNEKIWYSNGSIWFLSFNGNKPRALNRIVSFLFSIGGE